MATESDNFNLVLHILTDKSHDISNTALLHCYVGLLLPFFLNYKTKQAYVFVHGNPIDEPSEKSK